MAFGTKPINKVSDSEWFLREASAKIGWEDLSENVVMDIGCGTGTSSATFLELFPDVRKITAIDLYQENIEEAKANNPHEKLEYQVADIQDRSTLRQWLGQISKVISTYCINSLRRTEDGFANMHRLLQCGGEAALLIKLHGPFDKFLEKLYLSRKWMPYLAPFCEVMPPEEIRSMTERDYHSIAVNAAFEVIDCKVTERVYHYYSEDEYKKFIFHSIPIVKKMDQSVETEFKDYLVELMLQFSPKTEEGNFCIRNPVLSLLLRSPRSNQSQENII